MTLLAWLQAVLQQRLPTVAWNALAVDAANNAEHQAQAATRSLFLSFSRASRKVGKQALHLNPTELQAAQDLLPGWQPLIWRIDHAARIYLLLHLAHLAQADFLSLLDRLFQAADLSEAEALYLSLPLLPYADAHQARASEGLRSNIKTIFTAVAHYSPYPQLYFSDDAWNQMVLKALFVEAPLAPIVGLDARCNLNLTRMLCNYAQERRAAQRPVSPELWRCVGACPDAAAFSDLAQALQSGSPAEQSAIAHSLQHSADPAAAQLRTAYPQAFQRLSP